VAMASAQYYPSEVYWYSFGLCMQMQIPPFNVFFGWDEWWTSDTMSLNPAQRFVCRLGRAKLPDSSEYQILKD
jgi:hypothetical protein